MEALTASEDLKYQLETLATYEPNDIDSPEFEVAYENESGNEGFATVCCIDVAKRALQRIKALEEAIENSSAFGDGWYDGFLVAQKLAENQLGYLEDINKDEVLLMSEHAESIHAELKAKADLENEANDFALNLLLPKKAFADFIENKSQAVADIATHFKVENKVVMKRANDLGYSLSLPDQTA